MTCSTGIDCIRMVSPMSRRYYPRRRTRGSLPWLATLIVLAVFAAWQGYGKRKYPNSAYHQTRPANKPNVALTNRIQLLT